MEMNISEEYKMIFYQDYGPLGKKDNVHLLRDRKTGRICVSKKIDITLEDVITFRRMNVSVYFPRVLDVVRKEECFEIVEEYVEGITLEEYMMDEALGKEEAVQFACQICEALSCLHNALPMIVYRDLKPENIMVTVDKEIRLIDFHISRQYQEGKNRDTVLMGTAGYAAPEQFGFFQTDNRTDIYSFGVLFNYMLTGKMPSVKIAEGKYGEIIRKCIEVDPRRRFQRVEEIMKELRMSDQSVSEKAVSESEPDTWILPGFRSGVIWKKIAAIFGYMMIIACVLNLNFTYANGTPYTIIDMWINRIMFGVAQVTTVFLVTNYRGISKGIKWYQHKSHLIRMISYVVTWFFCMVMSVLFSIILESIFSG